MNWKLVALTLGAVMLGGCEPDDGERLKIESQPPKGCVFKDLGYYSGDPIFAVLCDGHATQSINYSVRKGKTHTHPMVVTLN